MRNPLPAEERAGEIKAFKRNWLCSDAREEFDATMRNVKEMLEVRYGIAAVAMAENGSRRFV